MLDRCRNYGDPGLWIRAAYREGFRTKAITAVVRAGDRVNVKDYRSLRVGGTYPVRFIQRPGVGFEIPAVLFPDDGTTVEINDGIVRTIAALTVADLRGTASDTATPELVRYHLALINNTELPAWQEPATIWRFRYLPDATE